MKKLILRLVCLALFALSVPLAACTEDRPPPTRDDVIFACGTYNLEACRTFGRCLGWSAAEIQACVDEENASCRSDVEAETCWENQRDALERCAERVAEATCEAAPVRVYALDEIAVEKLVALTDKARNEPRDLSISGTSRARGSSTSRR